jgi:hypothetical protein
MDFIINILVGVGLIFLFIIGIYLIDTFRKR